jgi:hypothetical protein
MLSQKKKTANFSVVPSGELADLLREATDKSKISPSDATEYSKSYLNLN